MGQSFSQQVEEKKKEKKPEEAFNLLETEQKMRDKLECTSAKLYIDALNDECLPIVCAVDKFHGFLVDVKHDHSILENEIDMKLAEHLSGDHLEELKGLVVTVLGNVLKSTKTHEVRQTHVVHANRSVIRIDYFLYIEVSRETKALFYYVQVGVIDMARVRLPVLIYELTRATQERQLKDAGEKLKNMADSTIHLNDAAQTLAKAARGEKIVTSSVDGTDGGNPPTSVRQQGAAPPTPPTPP